MKTNQHVKPIINVDAGTVVFNVKGHGDITLDIAKLHPDIVRRAALAGMAQVRIVDAAAIGMEDDDGNIIPEADRIAMKHAAMLELVEHYHTGTSEWSRKSSGGGVGARSITIEALAKTMSCDYDTAKAQVVKRAEAAFGGDTKKALAKLRESATIQKAILALRAERMPAAKVNADTELDALMKS